MVEQESGLTVWVKPRSLEEFQKKNDGKEGEREGERSENELRNHGASQDILVLFYVKLTIWKGPDHNCDEAYL